MNKSNEYYDLHILDIQSDDIENPERTKEKYLTDIFNITIYGKTSKNENIVCNIKGFKPYFYLKIPKSWDENYFKNLCETFLNINFKYNPCEIEKPKYYKDFYGYEWDYKKNKQKKYKFLKLIFNNYKSFTTYKYAITRFYKQQKNMKTDKKIKEFIDICTDECDSNLYEANIHPILRFIHEKNINPSGWIRIKLLAGKNREDAKIYTDDEKLFNCDIQIDCDINNIKELKNEEISNLIIASFDIECDSLTGEFPRAIKNFKSLSTEIYDNYINWYNLIDFEIDDDTKIEYIKSLINSAFIKDSEHVEYISYIDTENGIPTNKSIEKLEILNINFIKKIENSIELKTRSKIIDDICNSLDGKDTNKGLLNNKNKKILIKSDPIIQIGTVFYHTEKKIYEKYIQVIKPETDSGKICDSLEEHDIIVEECIDEEELLIKWKDLIINKNPDIITGYNILGFDFRYIDERIEYLMLKNEKRNKNLKNDIYNLGRIDTQSINYLNMRGEPRQINLRNVN